MSSELATLQERLKFARESAAFEQLWAADILERECPTPQTRKRPRNRRIVQSWEQGSGAPSLQEIDALARIYDRRVEWLAFGDSFEPMDNEERDMIENWRKLNPEQRAAFQTAIAAAAAGQTTQKQPGQRTRRKPLPSSPGNAPHKSAKQLLSPSERDAVLEYFSDVADTGRLELPLVVALRKISIFLDRQDESQTSPTHADEASASEETAEKNESSGATHKSPRSLPPS